MNVVLKPVALPGCCVMPACGSATRDSYLDTGLQFDFFGAVYICDLCLGEMARKMGFLEPGYVRQLKDRLEVAETELYERQREIDGLRMVVDGFTLARGTDGVDSVGSAGVPVVSDTETPSQREAPMGTGEDRPPESVHDEGVAELSDDGTGDEFQLRI